MEHKFNLIKLKIKYSMHIRKHIHGITEIRCANIINEKFNEKFSGDNHVDEICKLVCMSINASILLVTKITTASK